MLPQGPFVKTRLQPTSRIAPKHSLPHKHTAYDTVNIQSGKEGKLHGRSQAVRQTGSSNDKLKNDRARQSVNNGPRPNRGKITRRKTGGGVLLHFSNCPKNRLQSAVLPPSPLLSENMHMNALGWKESQKIMNKKVPLLIMHFRRANTIYSYQVLWWLNAVCCTPSPPR